MEAFKIAFGVVFGCGFGFILVFLAAVVLWWLIDKYG